MGKAEDRERLRAAAEKFAADQLHKLKQTGDTRAVRLVMLTSFAAGAAWAARDALEQIPTHGNA